MNDELTHMEQLLTMRKRSGVEGTSFTMCRGLMRLALFWAAILPLIAMEGRAASSEEEGIAGRHHL